MEVEYDDDDLERLETDPAFNANLSRDLVKAFRKRMQTIRAALDKRDFYPLRGLRFEALKGKRKGEHSSHFRAPAQLAELMPMRLNDQFRLIMKLEQRSRGTVVLICSIEDYHYPPL